MQNKLPKLPLHLPNVYSELQTPTMPTVERPSMERRHHPAGSSFVILPIRIGVLDTTSKCEVTTPNDRYFLGRRAVVCFHWLGLCWKVLSKRLGPS